MGASSWHRQYKRTTQLPTRWRPRCELVCTSRTRSLARTCCNLSHSSLCLSQLRLSAHKHREPRRRNHRRLLGRLSLIFKRRRPEWTSLGLENRYLVRSPLVTKLVYTDLTSLSSQRNLALPRSSITLVDRRRLHRAPARARHAQFWRQAFGSSALSQPHRF